LDKFTLVVSIAVVVFIKAESLGQVIKLDTAAVKSLAFIRAGPLVAARAEPLAAAGVEPLVTAKVGP